jgi:hypothetical protein
MFAWVREVQGRTEYGKGTNELHKCEQPFPANHRCLPSKIKAEIKEKLSLPLHIYNLFEAPRQGEGYMGGSRFVVNRRSYQGEV